MKKKKEKEAILLYELELINLHFLQKKINK